MVLIHDTNYLQAFMFTCYELQLKASNYSKLVQVDRIPRGTPVLSRLLQLLKWRQKAVSRGLVHMKKGDQYLFQNPLKTWPC